MRTKNIILLAVIACIGVVAFFFACKYSYESKLSALKEEAKNALIKAFFASSLSADSLERRRKKLLLRHLIRN